MDLYCQPNIIKISHSWIAPLQYEDVPRAGSSAGSKEAAVEVTGPNLMTLMHGDNSSHIWRRNARPEHHIFPPVFHPQCVQWVELHFAAHPPHCWLPRHQLRYLVTICSFWPWTSYIHTQIVHAICAYNIVYGGFNPESKKSLISKPFFMYFGSI